MTHGIYLVRKILLQYVIRKTGWYPTPVVHIIDLMSFDLLFFVRCASRRRAHCVPIVSPASARCDANDASDNIGIRNTNFGVGLLTYRHSSLHTPRAATERTATSAFAEQLCRVWIES